MNGPIIRALASAALFGASTPFAKVLLGELPPVLLAALLYLGSGIGLAGWLVLRRAFDRGSRTAPLERSHWPWLVAAIASGGVAGPILLMSGLQRTDASTASLLLNLEAVLTAAIAWLAFRENVDRRVFLGMLAIVAGGAVLSWTPAPDAGGATGPLLIAAACLAWAMDNNLTRRVSGGDAATIACLKGLAAGVVTLGIAVASGSAPPSPAAVAAAGALGLLGYGVSLVLFVSALRDLGTARTGAYFSVAPFFGAALALSLLGEQAMVSFWIAGGLMALGVWLHVTEHHQHSHVHEPMSHEHVHVHDEHHQHAHEPGLDVREPHVHAHRHGNLEHSHAHYPDLHHRHRH